MLSLEPDLSWWEHGRCVFVGDVKYKRTSQGEHSDLYQLLAYTTAANLPGGLLIYAAGDQAPRQTHLHQVRHAGKTLHVATLDLTAAPRHILAHIDRIAATVHALRGAVAPASA
jgi:5-methylcytosine-specific restriction enzyme subunit McrC